MTIILQEGKEIFSQEMRRDLKLLSLFNRRQFFWFLLIFKILNTLECPQQLRSAFRLRSTIQNRELRDKTRLNLPKVNS